MREPLRMTVSSSNQTFGFQGVNDVMWHVLTRWGMSKGMLCTIFTTHDMCDLSRLIQHPSTLSAAKATRILLDDRNRYWGHAPTSILGRRNKSFTPPKRMPRLSRAKHETGRGHPTDSVIRHGEHGYASLYISASSRE